MWFLRLLKHIFKMYQKYRLPNQNFAYPIAKKLPDFSNLVYQLATLFTIEMKTAVKIWLKSRFLCVVAYLGGGRWAMATPF